MYPYETSTEGGLASNSVLGGLIGLASGVADVYAKVKGKPSGLATPPQSQQATKSATQARPWLPWVIGGVVVAGLALLSVVLLRKNP